MLVWVCFECDKRVFGVESAMLCECGGSFEELGDTPAVRRPEDDTGDQSELVRTLQAELRRLERENTQLRDKLG